MSKNKEEVVYRFEEENHVHEIKVDDEWKPLTGTSSVTDVMAKGGLIWWGVGLALEMLGYTKKKDENKKWLKKEKRLISIKKFLPKLKKMTDEEYLNLLDEAYYAHFNYKNEAAVDGTDLHEKVEEWIKGEMNGEKVTPDTLIMPLVKWAKENVDEWLWSEVHCYSEEHWLGGISDIGFRDKEGRIGILDIKSSKDAYLGHFIQCAGYDIQISENGGYTPDGEKIFDLDGKEIDYYAVLPFGMTNPEVQTRFNTDELREGFLAATTLYRLTKKY